MPSEMMNLRGLSSSSFFSDDACFPKEQEQAGLWKSDTVMNQHANEKSVTPSHLERSIPVEYQTVESPGHYGSFPVRDQKVNLCLDSHAVGAETVADQSSTFLKSTLNGQQAPYFAENKKVNMMASEYESSLFSSSLSELFSRKLRLSSQNSLYGHSFDTVASHCEEEEPFESLDEIEAQTIGNLLPNDDDLFSGVTGGLEMPGPNCTEEAEELDLFSSVGGMDLGDDGSSVIPKGFPREVSDGQIGLYNGAVVGEHARGEHPSRTLFVRNINSNVEDSELRALFEQYGDIHTLYTAGKDCGFIMISYYDIRAAQNAMKTLQSRPLRHRKLDIHYSISKESPSQKDVNQGTLMVYNLDSSVSNEKLHEILSVYGEIKEICEIPQRNHQKLIEFYDVRAAEAALIELNNSEIGGKQIKLEPSQPLDSRCLVQQFPPEEQDQCGLYQSSPPNNQTSGFSEFQMGGVTNASIPSSSMDNRTVLGVNSAIGAPFLEPMFRFSTSSSVSNNLPSTLRVESIGNPSSVAESGNFQGQLKFDVRAAPTFHPHSLPEYEDGLTRGIHHNSSSLLAANINVKHPEIIGNRPLGRVGSNGHAVEFNECGFASLGNGSHLFPGHPYSWSNSYHPQRPGMMWPQPSSIVNGICASHSPGRLHGLPRTPSHMLNTVLPLNNHHVGSAPTVNASLWDRRHLSAGESPDTSGFHPGSLGSVTASNNSPHTMEYVSHNIFPHVGGNCMDLSMHQKLVGFHPLHPRPTMYGGRGQIIPMINSVDSPHERARSRRNEGSVNQADKKQYELDIDHIIRGEDKRTTLMIKNIPNKYTSKMLLAAIDEHHRGTYDFIYLPIDFKNKCNVGYAFINMIEPSYIIPFYQAFNGKKWEKFNSEKVASLAYARIQGKAALIAHFQNSSLMNEDKRCRPILFNTDGPNAGDQVPFPMGVNVRTRPGKPHSNFHEENHQETTPYLVNGENLGNGETCSAKE